MPSGQRTAAPALRIFLWSRLALWAVAAVTVLAFESALSPERARWDSDRLHELGSVVDTCWREGDERDTPK